MPDRRHPWVDQTHIGGLHADIPGNCWQACVASLLELPLDAVPHFVHEWWTRTREFVATKLPGHELLCFQTQFPVYDAPEDSLPYVILSGRSPRGDWLHSVIACAVTGDIVHDPHPSRAGILTRRDICAIVAAGHEAGAHA